MTIFIIIFGYFGLLALIPTVIFLLGGARDWRAIRGGILAFWGPPLFIIAGGTVLAVIWITLEWIGSTLALTS